MEIQSGKRATSGALGTKGLTDLSDFLHLLWCRPGREEVSEGHVLEFGAVFAHVLSLRVPGAPELDGIQSARRDLLPEGRARAPHPTPRVHRVITVDQKLFESLKRHFII